jgi:cytochrome-b5 reductase
LTYADLEVKNIGMLAGGTGITPMFQILQAAHKNKDVSSFSLIFGNKTAKDILMKDDIDQIHKSKTFDFNLNYLIDKYEEGWEGLTGYVNREMISKHLPAPGHDSIILLCGPPIMCEKSKAILLELGHSKDSIYEF